MNLDHDALFAGALPAKRHRTQRVFVRNTQSRLAEGNRLSSLLLDASPVRLESHLPAFQPLLPSTSEDFYHLSGVDTFMMPGADMASGVPRVASSAHINELVAKYSQPSVDDQWSPRPVYSGVIDRGLGLMPDGMPSLRTSDFPAGYVDQHCPPEGARPSAVSPVLSERNTDLAVQDADYFQVQDLVFEDLAILAANADIENDAGEGFWAVEETPGVSGEDDPAVVEGLEMEEDTRQAVAKWLRDSPEAGHGLSDAPDALAAEEEEKSLPQWVLDELGESSGNNATPSTSKLVRAESNGSSTNVPSYSFRNDVWEVDDGHKSVTMDWPEGDVKVEKDELKNGAENAVENPQCEEAEVSIFSSPGEENLAEDEDQSATFQGKSMNMSRSFSTAWMKDLMEEGDTFREGLGNNDLAVASTMIDTGCEDSGLLCSPWIEKLTSQ